MGRALDLARSVLGTTSPNPAVGAVVVKDGIVVGEGATQPPGQPHAEKVALAQAGEKAKGATLYVTFEPCCHYGRTPPCTKAIIAAGIAEVHIATIDPNPLVAGKGRAGVERAGIRTYLGEREQEARELNEAFIKWITTGMPFVIAKFAMSLDGKAAASSGDSRWITGEEARWRVHEVRRVVDAIMVGSNTVRQDDPQLTARDSDGKPFPKQPLRVIVDIRGTVSPVARMFKEPGRTLVAVAGPLDEGRMAALKKARAEVAVLPERDGLVDMKTLMEHLGGQQITSVLVEGGGEVLASMLEQGLVDKVMAFIAPVIIGGKSAPTPVGGKGVERVAEALRLSKIKVERFGEDVMISGYLGQER